jgi:2-haloacid dehalogenase
MTRTIGFDVYGTLIDPLNVTAALRPFLGERSAAAAMLWRAKQLEYSFRRGLMRRYASFDVCTEQALKYVELQFQLQLAPSQRTALLEEYQRLPAYADAKPGLGSLAAAGHLLFAFTNGVEETVRRLLNGAGILPLVQGVISVDDLHTFKPDPEVYRYLSRRAQLPGDTWLVSANPFDVLGAKSAGLKAAWVRRRAETVFDPWDIGPDLVVEDLEQLAERWNRGASES